jgi:hypothetical protein
MRSNFGQPEIFGSTGDGLNFSIPEKITMANNRRPRSVCGGYCVDGALRGSVVGFAWAAVHGIYKNIFCIFSLSTGSDLLFFFNVLGNT